MMCGRYEIVDGKRIFVRFKVANRTPEMLANLDVRPTQQAPVILPDHQLTLMKWGLAPVWAKDEAIGNKTINARAEGDRREAVLQAVTAESAGIAAGLSLLRVAGGEGAQDEEVSDCAQGW